MDPITASQTGALEYLKTTWLWPGFVEVGQFLGTHLISGMLPAFLIAGAIAVFLEKERITRLMGKNANPLIAYPVAAFSGAILTVCSCGVLPIFSGILTCGAGIGPAFTFLFAAPAINLIALTYTYTFMGKVVALGRIVAVLICSIVIGFFMRLVFSENAETVEPKVVFANADDEGRTDLQTLLFFIMLVFLMLSSTGFMDKLVGLDALAKIIPALAGYIGTPWESIIPKLVLVFLTTMVLAIMSFRWFHPDEIRQWLKKSYSLFMMIFPKVLLGIFLSGLLAALFPLSKFMAYFDKNTLQSNFLVSLIGSMMYFGTIVGVNIVATMTHFGMHQGPALALLLSGPAVSLPSIMALVPIVGRKKTVVFLGFVLLTTTISGMIFGMLIQ